MNAFLSRLEAEHSKEQTIAIVEEILQKPALISHLIDCFYDEDNRINQRASWPLTHLADKAPELLLPYIKGMVENLEKPHHDAVVRNTVRTFQVLPIPEELEGEVFERCFHYILDVKQAIAIRVFSMTVCANIARKYPELQEELRFALEEIYEKEEGKGILSRCRTVLKTLRNN